MANEKPIQHRETVNEALDEARSRLDVADGAYAVFDRTDLAGKARIEEELRACAEACRQAADAVALVALAEMRKH